MNVNCSTDILNVVKFDEIWYFTGKLVLDQLKFKKHSQYFFGICIIKYNLWTENISNVILPSLIDTFSFHILLYCSDFFLQYIQLMNSSSRIESSLNISGTPVNSRLSSCNEIKSLKSSSFHYSTFLAKE